MKPMTKCLFAALLVGLLPGLSSGQTYEDAELRAPDAAEYDFVGWAVAVTETHALVGAPNTDWGSVGEGAAYLYRRTSTGWDLVQTLRSWDPALGMLFGERLVLSDRLAAFGVRQDTEVAPSAGAVFVFSRGDAGWMPEAKILPPDHGRGYGFGILLALDQDRLFIKHSWHIHVAHRTAVGAWQIKSEVAYSDPPGGPAGSVSAIAASGSVLVLGDVNNERAVVFEEGPGGWTEVAVLTDPTPHFKDRFGFSAAAEGDRIIIGATADSDSPRPGSAFVFRRTGPPPNNWVLEQELQGTQPNGEDWFGISVAFGGGRIAVDAPLSEKDPPWDNTTTGSIYLFRHDGDTWVHEDRFLGTDESGIGGGAVDLSASWVVGGAYFATNPDGIPVGSAFVFDLPLGEVICEGQPNSTGLPAQLVAKGGIAVSTGALRLTATDIPILRPVVFLASRTGDQAITPGGSQGLLCLGAPIARWMPPVDSGFVGQADLTVDPGAIPLDPAYAIQPGETWYFQAWYRDGNPQPTSNLTNALGITFR
jgi:FG-GAP repeat